MFCGNPHTEPTLGMIASEAGSAVSASRIRDRIFASVDLGCEKVSAGELGELILKAAQRYDYHAADLAVP